MNRKNSIAVMSALGWLFSGFPELGAQEPPPPPPEPGTEPVIKVSLRDGVHFKSDDGNFDILLGGYVGIQYRAVAHRPDDHVRTSPDTWYIRQARPELSGILYKDFDFRVQLDFPTGPAAIDGTVQDCWAGWRYYPELSLRVGQFKEPFGQEETTPDRFLDFDERSEGDRFTPQRDIGAEAYGTIASGFLTYEVGWFNGQGRAVAAANKGKEEAGRLRVQPFVSSDDSFFLKALRLGVAGTLAGVQKNATNALTSNTSYLNINYLTTLAVPPAASVLEGPRRRRGGELSWTYGPLGIRGEAWRRTDSVDPGAGPRRTLATDAWSAQATWLLTGETKVEESRLLPFRPFDPRSGTWGALEAAARVDRVHIDRDLFSLGIAAQAGNANVVTGYSFGLNWYLTRSIRISPDLFWERTDLPIAFAGGRTDAHFFGGILRFQLEF